MIRQRTISKNNRNTSNGSKFVPILKIIFLWILGWYVRNLYVLSNYKMLDTYTTRIFSRPLMNHDPILNYRLSQMLSVQVHSPNKYNLMSIV